MINSDENNEENKNEEMSEESNASEIEALKKEVAENLAGWQRAKADFVNYKKDQERTLSEFRKYANHDLITALLPTVDNFDLAMKHLPEDLKDSDWVKGIVCIKGMFDNFLHDAGVEEIKVLGEKFDPNKMEAVGEEESEKEEGTVIDELQKGYMMGEKLLRPAKVKVAK